MWNAIYRKNRTEDAQDGSKPRLYGSPASFDVHGVIVWEQMGSALRCQFTGGVFAGVSMVAGAVGELRLHEEPA